MDSGVFWSGDTVTEGSGKGNEGKIYKFDSMLSSHEWARAFGFSTLEMTDAGSAAEGQWLYQELKAQLENITKNANWNALIESKIFGNKLSVATEMGTQKLKGLSPGRWWDAVSENFAEKQSGIVWCVHASTFDNYWKTTLDLVKNDINVTWFNKEYPNLHKKLGEPTDDNAVHAIVEIYEDKITVSTLQKAPQPKEQLKPSNIEVFSDLEAFLESDLFKIVAGNRNEALKAKMLNSKKEGWTHLKAPNKVRAAGASSRIDVKETEKQLSPMVTPKSGEKEKEMIKKIFGF
jgi:hypothetical protein